MREKQTVYLETTIPSYLVAKPSRDVVVAGHQQITHDWWETRRNDFSLYVSEFVMDEIARGNPAMAARRFGVLAGVPVLEANDEIPKIAGALVMSGAIPRVAYVDATHLAVATIYGCDFLLTWNCRHLAAAQSRRIAERVLLSRGYVPPVVCTPVELMGARYGMERSDR